MRSPGRLSILPSSKVFQRASWFLFSEHRVDVLAVGLEGFRLLIMPLGRRERPVAQKRRRHADMLWIGDGERGRRGIPEQMWIDRDAEGIGGVLSNTIV